MIIKSDGKLNITYLESLCLIFFPGSKFSSSEQEGPYTPILEIRQEEDEDSIKTYAAFCLGEQRSEGFGSVKKTSKMAEKKSAGKAVVEAGKGMFGFSPSWGFLTGIRPAKIAMDMLEDGMDPAMVKREIRREYSLLPKKAALLTNIALNEREILSKTDSNGCSVYISIPFCPTRCSYCSFVSYSTKRLLSMLDSYVDRLIADIDRTFDMIEKMGKKVLTVYIGGGTPTVLDEKLLDKLLSAIEKKIDVDGLLEYSLEAGRPDTINEEKLKIILSHGIKRISINPQTLHDAVLEKIGRKHSAKDFYDAFELARKVGVDDINTDLIAGLPGEGFRRFSKSMDAILQLKPENITVHTFCVKKSADIIHSEKDIYSNNGGDTQKSIDYSQLKAKNAGYIPYYIYRQKNAMGSLENVGFSIPGREGLYNIFAMEEVHSIFACGAGAVTKMIHNGKIERKFFPKYPYEYMDMSDDDINNYFSSIGKYFSES